MLFYIAELNLTYKIVKDTMIKLEPFTENDFEVFKSWVHNEEELFQFAGPLFSYPVTDDQLKNYTKMTDRKPLKISYQNDKFKKVVDVFALFEQKKEIKKISADIESQLSYYLTYFRLTIIAFPLFAALGIMTVVFTW